MKYWVYMQVAQAGLRSHVLRGSCQGVRLGDHESSKPGADDASPH